MGRYQPGGKEKNATIKQSNITPFSQGSALNTTPGRRKNANHFKYQVLYYCSKNKYLFIFLSIKIGIITYFKYICHQITQ